MKELRFRLQLVVEDEEAAASEEIIELSVLEKDCERLEHLGLTLAESKEILGVVLETTDTDIRERLPSMGLTLEQTEDGTLLRCPTRNLNWMARLLAGLDCSFVVRQPDELREALEQRAEEISALAKRTGTETLSQRAQNPGYDRVYR